MESAMTAIGDRSHTEGLTCGIEGPPKAALKSERERVLDIVSAKFASKPLYVAALLRLPDLLLNRSLNSSQIAAETATHPDSIYRLLRALASLGFFVEDAEGAFSTSLLGELVADRPHSLRPLLLWMNDPRHDLLWGGLLHAVKTGEPVAQHVVGQSFWDYLDSQGDLFAAFNDCMSANAQLMHRAALAAYDFGSLGTVVDVGGGQGALLQAILERAPTLRGILIDRPAVVARVPERLASAGLSQRCEVVAGDFFAAVPRGDVFVMSHVLHDWNDAECLRLLTNCRRASCPGARVVIVEVPVPARNERSFSKLLDLEMLVLAGGRERTVEQYQRLLIEAGYVLGKLVKTRGPAAVIEGVLAETRTTAIQTP